MKWLKRNFTSSITIFLILIAAFAYALTSVEIKSYPDATDSATVISNKLSSIAYPYLEQILEGNIPDHTFVQVRGHAHSIGTADQELSALATAGFGNWPAAALGAVLVSTDVDDDGDPVDTGARTVIVRGLDENWDLAEETVTMNGTTPTAATTVTFIRINEIEVVAAGTSLSNEGTITASISGTNIIAMFATHSTSDAGRYTIPAGYTGFFQNLEGSAIGNKEMTYHIFCRNTTVANSPFLLRMSWHSKDGGFRPNGRIRPFTEKTDFVFIAHAEIAGAKASASVEGWIEAN